MAVKPPGFMWGEHSEMGDANEPKGIVNCLPKDPINPFDPFFPWPNPSLHYPNYPSKSIYPGTFMTGYTLPEARKLWHPEFRTYLAPHIHLLSPMRGYEDFADNHVMVPKEYNHNPLVTDAGIVTQDFNDVKTADLLVMYMLKATKMSQGMISEIAWAYAMQKPIIAIVEKEGNVHEHPFFRRQVAYKVETVKEAAKIANRLLTPGI